MKLRRASRREKTSFGRGRTRKNRLDSGSGVVRGKRGGGRRYAAVRYSICRFAAKYAQFLREAANIARRTRRDGDSRRATRRLSPQGDVRLSPPRAARSGQRLAADDTYVTFQRWKVTKDRSEAGKVIPPPPTPPPSCALRQRKLYKRRTWERHQRFLRSETRIRPRPLSREGASDCVAREHRASSSLIRRRLTGKPGFVSSPLASKITILLSIYL